MSIGQARSRGIEQPSATVPPMLALPRIRPADILLFGYVLVLAKQFFWYFSNNTTQWALAFILSIAAMWVLGLRRDEGVEKLPFSFWLIVVVPLTFIFLLQVSSPDTAYDVLNYRLVYSERSL